MNLFNKTKVEDRPISHEEIKRMNEERQIKNYPIGSKVITRSNEDNPYQIGVIKAYQPITQAQTLIPIVEIEDKEYVCMATIRHHSDELCKILDKLTPREQWVVLNEWGH